ncbi:hypothetical protein [Flavobacterium aquiphilum]|uniref:hypothetical protein n=1 Tax=Flavobacterium aquiphilum TaxID=3003261 RepID=UPI00248044FF|nr:hypothetical protein [Flavobacterium aquiphilum]
MKDKIIANAKEDLPLYFQDFNTFWNKSVAEMTDDELYTTYRSSLVFKNWKVSLNSIDIKNLDLIFDELFEDINASFFLALLGLYRSAHMHMRSSIELSFQLLYFLHHPIEYKLWLQGDFVIKFDKLQEYFNNHPNFETDIRPLIQNIFKNWKTFSKHIHGESPIFFQCEKDVRKTSSFSRKDFGIWKSNFEKNVYYLNKLFLLFFKKDFNRIPEASRNILTSLLEEDEKTIMNA